MKSKGLTYLLLTLVCLIWGIIIYRIVSGIGEDMPTSGGGKADTFVDLDTVSESYQLIATYRDPFLGKSNGVAQALPSVTNVKPSKVKVANKPVLITPKPVVYIDWSFIQYNGLISNKGKGKLIGLVKIKGNDHMVSVNTTINDLTITFLSKDSVGVLYQGQNKKIGR